MATGTPQKNTGTGDYVTALEIYLREMPIGEQLGQVNEAAKGKAIEFVDQANISFEHARNDPSNRAKDAASSYNTAVNQVTNVVNSVTGAFSSTKNSGTTTATSAPNVLDSAPARPAQFVTESIGQTAFFIVDAVENTSSPRQTVPETEPDLRTAANISTALSSVCFVLFWLLFVATTVTARLVANVSGSVSSAVQERLLTDEQVAFQEIARALNRNVVTSTFSWAQSGFLLGIEVVKVFTNILTFYLVDRWRKIENWKSYLPCTLEDALKPVVEQLAANGNEVTAASNRVATSIEDAGKQFAANSNEATAASNRVATSIEDAGKQFAANSNEVTAALSRVATSIEDVGKQFVAYANEVVDLSAQLVAALNLTNAKREEEERNKVDWLEERLRVREPYRKGNLTSRIWPPVETEPGTEGGRKQSLKEEVIRESRKAAGFLSE